MNTLGGMLPYTELHHLLFQTNKIDTVVMTSANLSVLPIMYKDEDAYHYLNGTADYVLIHNQEILHPADDAVVQIEGGVLYKISMLVLHFCQFVLLNLHFSGEVYLESNIVQFRATNVNNRNMNSNEWG
jgi:hypothetical protein